MIAVFEKIDEKAILPHKHRETDAGYDVHCTRDINLQSHGGRATTKKTEVHQWSKQWNYHH